MGIVPKETIEVIAQSIGITNLAPDVAVSFAPDVEYWVREIMQEAIKCMHPSRRTVLTTGDIDSALNLRNVELPSDVTSSEWSTLPFSLVDCLCLGFRLLMHVYSSCLSLSMVLSLENLCVSIELQDTKTNIILMKKDMEFGEEIEAPLPESPLDSTVLSHWKECSRQSQKMLQLKEDGLPIDVKSPVKPVLSTKCQLYFDKITGLVINRSNSLPFKQALVSRNLNNFPLLFALMHVIQSLLCNSHIHIEPYLHQLMPSTVTCIITKRLGNKFSDNRWELRSFTADRIASIWKWTLLHCFLDPTKTLPQHFGAIHGLAALGPNVVRLLILPNLDPYMQLLEPEMQPEKQRNEMKQHEAWCVYGAMLVSFCNSEILVLPCGKSMHVQSAKDVSELVISANTYHLEEQRKYYNYNTKDTMQDKCKASVDNFLQQQQPPLTMAAVNAPMDMIPANSMAVDMQGLNSEFSTGVASDGSLSSMTRALSNNILGSSNSGKTPRVSPVFVPSLEGR
ncbi:TATA box binding protein associated factor (TAF), histone-like fold domain [Dillenia turbinata]|uniref:TATA box binding protein associated factor (TAF), histone-like fold domain n=1 Tax=Dillenia turbinata TaxID=194707 RepID=A0AAN8W6R6_9MAGN